MANRKDGRETWHRLRDWDKGSTDSERLAYLILESEGYKQIDPSHPLGGRDGKKDLICSNRENKTFIGACFFPRGNIPFYNVFEKFKSDYDGAQKYNTDGFLFVTNQELTLSEREDLVNYVNPKIIVDIFHLERISTILNSPYNYGTRLEFLDIEMTKEDQISILSRQTAHIYNLTGEVIRLNKELSSFNKHTTNDKIETKPVMVEELNSLNSVFGSKIKYHSCSSCKYGFKTIESPVSQNSGSFYGSALGIGGLGIVNKIVTCPKCGNSDPFF